MKKVLLAGASGTLGRHVARAFKERGYWVRAIARDPEKLRGMNLDDIVSADLTKPESLRGVCEGMDWVFSCAGARMSMNNFKDKASFYQVDFRGNLNLLEEAREAAISKFGYVSLACAARLSRTEYADAHERFVTALQASGVNHVVVRPTGFYGFMLEILKYAKKGRGVLIGAGDCKTNPIHEADLAPACVEAMEGDKREVAVGGPDVLTRRQITELAFETLNARPKLTKIPPGLFKAMIAPLRLMNRRVYALMDFGVAVTQVDVIAPAYGKHNLKSYFAEAAKQLN